MKKWVEKNFLNIAPLQRGFDLPKPQLISGEYPVVYSNGIENYHKYFMAKSPGVVTGRSGTIGKVTYVEKDYWPHNTALWVTDFKCNDPRFIFYLYSYINLERFGTGSGVPTLNRNDVHDYVVSIPATKEEQTAIAAALSDADALIQSLEKLIAKKRSIKQGAMQKLLKPKEGWVVKKLGEVGEIITGSTPPTEVKEYWNGNIPWITPTDISLKTDIFCSEREITSLGLKVVRKLPANTLLVTCIASIGKNVILRRAGSCNQQINAIVPDSNNDIEFLYYLIENSNQYLLSKAGITATNIISKKDFAEITFSIPLLEEQTRIAAILSDMDAEIAALETKLAKYKQIKQGMMQELLTGRIRLI